MVLRSPDGTSKRIEYSVWGMALTCIFETFDVDLRGETLES